MNIYPCSVARCNFFFVGFFYLLFLQINPESPNVVVCFLKIPKIFQLRAGRIGNCEDATSSLGKKESLTRGMIVVFIVLFHFTYLFIFLFFLFCGYDFRLFYLFVNCNNQNYTYFVKLQFNSNLSCRNSSFVLV